MKQDNIEKKLNARMKQLADLKEIKEAASILSETTYHPECRLTLKLLYGNYIMQEQLLEELISVYKNIKEQLDNQIQQN